MLPYEGTAEQGRHMHAWASAQLGGEEVRGSAGVGLSPLQNLEYDGRSSADPYPRATRYHGFSCTLRQMGAS